MSAFSRDSYHMLFNMDEFQYSMRGLKILLIAFVLFHLLAGLVSPLAYKLVFAIQASFPNSVTEYLTGKPFPEYYDRGRYLFLLLSLPWMFAKCHMFSAIKLGYRSTFSWHSNFLRWYLAGLIWATCVFGLLTALGHVQFQPSLSFGTLLIGLVLSFLSAFAIGSIEEVVFRGLFFRMFYTAFAPLFSIVLSSLFFAYLHFKNPVGLWDFSTPPEEVQLMDGLIVGWYVIIGIVYNFDLVLFLNLSLVGVTLTIVFMRTKSLWAAIGLHAGWVTSVLWISKIALRTDEELAAEWWGSYRLLDGYFCTFSLLIFAVFLSLFYKPRQQKRFEI
ncbi:MAG: hypothetical protein CMI18_03265 [Opitutaceae bacterium]|nr:hypothetical protein [Opitutaceae bacterium]|tara:strand:+ start:4819 stop:5811 length:993 start_codon:yes stop_codon:yes gene_type:complete